MQESFISFLQHHWLLSATFVVATIAVFIIQLIDQKRAAMQVSPSKLIQMINHEEAVVIDLRSDIIYKDGHIIGAQSIPSTNLETQSKKLDKYKSKPIVLVCQNGTEAAKAAVMLRDKGFNIHVLAGGMRSWQEADLPVVKG